MENFSRDAYLNGTFDVVFRNGQPVKNIQFLDDYATHSVVSIADNGQTRLHLAEGRQYNYCDDQWDLVLVKKIADAWVAIIFDDADNLVVKHYESEKIARRFAPGAPVVNLRTIFRTELAKSSAQS